VISEHCEEPATVAARIAQLCRLDSVARGLLEIGDSTAMDGEKHWKF
jgi:hypothetical protein